VHYITAEKSCCRRIEIWIAVVDASNKPLTHRAKRAEMELYRVRRTHSNSSGEFQFDAIPPGAYFIWSVVDMNSLTRRIVVEAGQRTTVFLTND
jgi:protocatechuate 3,4-dioxygenase beta subunit